MQSLIVQAHPDPDSFCAACVGALAAGLTDGHDSAAPDVINLYADGFSPVLDLQELRRRFPLDPVAQNYIRRLTAAQLIVFVYPEWWGSPPAILKGLLDRILRPEIAYEFREERDGRLHPSGLWSDKTLLPVITTDSNPSAAATRARVIWQSASEFCGAELADPCVFGPVYISTDRQRREFLLSLQSLQLP